MIHVLFCPSAAGTLRQLLRSRGITDRVVALTEWLDWGWIASERIEDRLQWFEENAGLDWDWLADCGPKFLRELAVDDDQLIWIAPRSAQEQCGLYWFMQQMQQPPAMMIIAEYALEGAWRDEPPLSLGELPDSFMAQLLDDCPRREWDSSRFPLQKWRSLMEEGAALRIVDDGALRSAQSDHFDPLILHHCPPQWAKWYRVIGDAMGNAAVDGHRANDLFLRWRLEQLIESGAIETTGELPNWDMPTTIDPPRIRRAN